MRRAGVTLLILLALTAALVTVSALRAARSVPRSADIIVVLGASMTPDGTLGSPSVARVERGVELFQQGLAPRILFTGGRAAPGGPSAGARMARLAESLGVPSQAILKEEESQSTLQNAKLSVPLVGGGEVLLVTHGYHIARARASFAWAGIRVTGHAAPSAFHRGLKSASLAILRETVAWPFNLVRVGLYHGGAAFGVSEPTRMRWLARAADAAKVA